MGVGVGVSVRVGVIGVNVGETGVSVGVCVGGKSVEVEDGVGVGEVTISSVGDCKDWVAFEAFSVKVSETAAVYGFPPGGNAEVVLCVGLGVRVSVGAEGKIRDQMATGETSSNRLKNSAIAGPQPEIRARLISSPSRLCLSPCR